MKAYIRHIESYVPDSVLTNNQLENEFAGWDAKKIEEKTGVVTRHIAKENECSSDLGVIAAQRLFDNGICKPSDVDYLLLCTQSPDYYLPTTACLMQERLKIPVSSGAIDYNLGCSGYVYGLGLAKGLIETNQANMVLLITAETYSKYIHPQDRSVRTIFGDGAAATIIQGRNSEDDWIGPFVYGTDGRGGSNLIVPTGGMRNPQRGVDKSVTEDASGNRRTSDSLYMNGAEILTFTLQSVPKVVQELLNRKNYSIEDIDMYVFHQANRFMLEHLRKKISIPPEKFVYALNNWGNTVSSTIPIALQYASQRKTLKPNSKVMLVGFGVGYSWGATLIRWEGDINT